MDFPFTTDGCSGHIYRNMFRKDPPWQGCCVEHDKLYWSGGSRHQRWDADIELMVCVARKGHPIVAFFMWLGVRFGGHPILPLPWRWGYGWEWPRGYTQGEV